MSAMLGALVDQVADEIRLGLPHDLLAHAEPDRARIVPRLWHSGALDRPALILLLLRRADEQLITAACRDSRGPGDGGTVERLVGDGDGAIAGAAMAFSSVFVVSNSARGGARPAPRPLRTARARI